MIRRKILISGGGIAGLTAALCLDKAGHNVDVFERARTIEPLGAGIQISPNAFHVLDSLDLGRELIKLGITPNVMRMMNGVNSETLVTIPLGKIMEQKYGTPYLVIHRADLHTILLKSCSDKLNIKLHFASPVDDVTNHENGVTARVKHDGNMHEYTGNILIAADGVHSHIRSSVFKLANARYSGKTAWRALIPADQIDNKDTLKNTTAWLGPKAHAVTYPVRNGQFLNVVVVTQDAETTNDSAIKAEELRNRFSHWSNDFTKIFACNTDWTGWPLYEMTDITTMTRGNIALIGDAAHTMLPFAAQGAAIAIEDACILSQCITQIDNVESALKQFETLRLPRVRRIVKTARSNGKVYHLTGLMALARNLGLRKIPGERLLQKQDWVYRWKP